MMLNYYNCLLYVIQIRFCLNNLDRTGLNFDVTDSHNQFISYKQMLV